MKIHTGRYRKLCLPCWIELAIYRYRFGTCSARRNVSTIQLSCGWQRPWRRNSQTISPNLRVRGKSHTISQNVRVKEQTRVVTGSAQSDRTGWNSWTGRFSPVFTGLKKFLNAPLVPLRVKSKMIFLIF
jgi:hypothetical protein